MPEAENERPMGESDLNQTDTAILELLAEGRETRKSLADQLDKHPNYISERLDWLQEWDLARCHHKGTALFEITNGGAELIPAE